MSTVSSRQVFRAFASCEAQMFQCAVCRRRSTGTEIFGTRTICCFLMPIDKPCCKPYCYLCNALHVPQAEIARSEEKAESLRLAREEQQANIESRNHDIHSRVAEEAGGTVGRDCSSPPVLKPKAGHIRRRVCFSGSGNIAAKYEGYTVFYRGF